MNLNIDFRWPLNEELIFICELNPSTVWKIETKHLSCFEHSHPTECITKKITETLMWAKLSWQPKKKLISKNLFETLKLYNLINNTSLFTVNTKIQ